jgi:HNH endonuclease
MSAGGFRERLLSRAIVNPETSCWEWAGCKDQWGYGYIKDDGRMVRVHRAAYEMWFGPIPGGLEIDHLCFVRHCLNPDHLEAVPGLVNIMRSNAAGAINARKTRCDSGHEFTESNTYIDPSGKRACVECKQARARESYAANPEKEARRRTDHRARNLESVRARERAAKQRQRARRRAAGTE